MNSFHTPTSMEPFEIPQGLSARGVLKILDERGLISNERLTMTYLVLSGNRRSLKAGEYLFDHAVTTREVIDALVAGAVYLHKFTVPEGLTLNEVAAKWEEHGFGEAEEFIAAAEQSVDLLDFEGGVEGAGASVEGYLFPETYSFPIRTTPRQAIEAMVGRYRSVIDQLRNRFPTESWMLNARDTLILASL